VHVPAAIQALLDAKTERDATAAYWRLDNTVVVQGALYEAALPTTHCLVVGLASCTAVARPRVLELLVQTAGGECSRVELEANNHDLPRACAAALRGALGTFLRVVELGTDIERALAVDVLGLCGRVAPETRDQIAWHMRRYLTTQPHPQVQTLLFSWIDELEGGG
jgi:hypothetical protein